MVNYVAGIFVWSHRSFTVFSSRDQIFHAHHVASLKNRVWTLWLGKLGPVDTWQLGVNILKWWAMIDIQQDLLLWAIWLVRQHADMLYNYASVLQVKVSRPYFSMGPQGTYEKNFYLGTRLSSQWCHMLTWRHTFNMPTHIKSSLHALSVLLHFGLIMEHVLYHPQTNNILYPGLGTRLIIYTWCAS